MLIYKLPVTVFSSFFRQNSLLHASLNGFYDKLLVALPAKFFCYSMRSWREYLWPIFIWLGYFRENQNSGSSPENCATSEGRIVKNRTISEARIVENHVTSEDRIFENVAGLEAENCATSEVWIFEIRATWRLKLLGLGGQNCWNSSDLGGWKSRGLGGQNCWNSSDLGGWKSRGLGGWKSRGLRCQNCWK